MVGELMNGSLLSRPNVSPLPCMQLPRACLDKVSFSLVNSTPRWDTQWTKTPVFERGNPLSVLITQLFSINLPPGKTIPADITGSLDRSSTSLWGYGLRRVEYLYGTEVWKSPVRHRYTLYTEPLYIQTTSFVAWDLRIKEKR